MDMVPPPLSPTEPTPAPADDEPIEAIPVLGPTVRGSLLWLAAGLIAVFAIAVWLDPYERDAQGNAVAAKTSETHRQIGLPPCTFKQSTGVPCPSCGMTTSFALVMHADPLKAAEANPVGTILAIFCLLLIPWCIVSGILGRPFFVVAPEIALARVVVGFLFLMLSRWGIALAVAWFYART